MLVYLWHHTHICTVEYVKNMYQILPVKLFTIGTIEADREPGIIWNLCLWMLKKFEIIKLTTCTLYLITFCNQLGAWLCLHLSFFLFPVWINNFYKLNNLHSHVIYYGSSTASHRICLPRYNYYGMHTSYNTFGHTSGGSRWVSGVSTETPFQNFT